MFLQLNNVIWRHFQDKFVLGLIKNRSSTENQNFGSFSVNFQFRAEVKKVNSSYGSSQLGSDSSLVVYVGGHSILSTFMFKNVDKGP